MTRACLCAMAAGVVLTACSVPPPLAPASGLVAASTAPSPSPSAAASSAPAPNCGDATASLHPQGPLPQPGSMPAGSYMQTIYERGRLVAGVSRDTLLFGSVNPSTGQIEGFDIDVLRQVAKAIFGDEGHVELRVITPAQRIPALRAGTVDIVGRTFTVNCARRQQIDFSTVYYSSGQRIMVPRGSPIQSLQDASGKRVCTPAGGTGVDTVARFAPRAIQVQVADQTDCLVLLEQGQADVAENDEAVLQGLAMQDASMEVVGPRLTVEPYGLGIAQSHPEFTRFVNAVLERMRQDGTWAQIYNRWLAARLGPSPGPPPARYRD